MLADSQLQAFSVARRLVMFSDVVRTCTQIQESKIWKNQHPFARFILLSILFHPLFEVLRELIFNLTSNYHLFTVFTGLTAGEVSSGSRILMASGLFSEQNLQHRKNHKEVINT